ncbi:hypothetical protein [Falsiroseomonas sp.]|uniref:hypothetical protein n=1 Tax=Falsiroseomonas sp. TaxID=2870721 RepID=UPI003F70027C
MHILTFCAQCLTEYGVPNMTCFEAKILPDDGACKITCDKGHSTVIIVQDEKFEILAGMAARDIAEDSYRSSVLNFTASLERLYEFFIRLIFRAKKLDDLKVDRLWRQIRKQSERQFGAFMTLYLTETGEPYVPLPDSQTALRNRVAHDGLICSRSEALEYGQAVWDCAWQIIKVVRADKYAEAARSMMHERLEVRLRHARQDGLRHGTTSVYHPFHYELMARDPSLENFVRQLIDRPSDQEIAAMFK